jgi:ABC-type glutathione transport system ATPase component
LQQELGVAYLFITHNFGVVEYLAHDIAVMKNGKLVEAGPAERVLFIRSTTTRARCSRQCRGSRGGLTPSRAARSRLL